MGILFLIIQQLSYTGAIDKHIHILVFKKKNITHSCFQKKDTQPEQIVSAIFLLQAQNIHYTFNISLVA